MAVSGKSKKELIEEISALRSRLKELEHSEAECKKAQEESKKSKEFLDNIINTLDDPFFVKDQEHGWFMLNDAACKVMGRPREELIGKSDYDLFPKEQADKFWERDSFVLESGQTDLNEEVITWHGKLHTISTKKSLFTDSMTRQKFITGTIRDITERKKTEEALRKSEELAKASLNATNDMVYLVDTLDNVLAVNDIAARNLGKTPDELIGTNIFSYFPPDVATSRKEYGDKVIRSGKHIRFQDEREGKFFDISIYPTFDSQGNVDRLAVFVTDITEQKRLEEAYRSLVDNSLQGLAIVQDGRMVFLNRAFSSTTGYSEQELLAASPEQLQSLVHPEDRELVWTRHRDRLAGKPVPPRYEFRWIRKDGSTAWVEIHASEIKYRGRPAIQAAYIDITRRKQIEEALRDSEDKYYALFQQSAQPMLLCNLETLEMVEFNDSAHNSLGYTREEFEKLKISDYEVIESPEEVEAHIQKIIKNGFDIFETQHRTKSGEIRNVLVNTKVINLNDTLYSIAILTDTTDRKRAEQALRESEEKFRTLAEQSPNMIHINKKGRMVYANKKSEEVMGYKREEFYSPDFDFMTLIAPDSLGLVKENFARHLRGEEVRPYDFALINRKGERIEAINTTKLIQYEGEMSILGIITDITERKQDQEKLLDYQGKLKSLTSQLSVIEERERRRLAAELHDQIGQSLVMSKMKLDSLRESLSPGVSTEILEDVCGCLKQVIQDTRTLTFDLSYPILYELGFETAVAEWLDERIREKHGIQTEFQDDGQPKLLDDDIRALLFRNVRELLINIVKHAKARKVKVSVCRVDEHIHVSIEDDGVGFDPVEVTSTAAQKAKFGLFSIRERLEQLAGHLEIESEPGRGSKIMMTVPLKVEQSTEGVEV